MALNVPSILATRHPKPAGKINKEKKLISIDQKRYLQIKEKTFEMELDVRMPVH